MSVREYSLHPNTDLQGGRYRIIRSLGCGGFGITYLAEQVMAERKVCIKEFFPKEYYNRNEDSRSISIGSQGSVDIMERYKEKFVKEAKTIAKLDHPNIIHIFDVFEENNTCYYVMEYIEGESLSELVKRCGALTETDALRYIREVASALGYIHDRKINHLDVKPGNIMVRREDNRAILIDFGLSKHYDSAGDQTSSTPVGISHGFAPIEQYKQGGVGSFSPTTDIYALGATLYYLATGNVPPSATDIGEDGLPALPTHLSSSLCKAIERSMSYWRKDRPQSIKAFVALMDGCGASMMAVADESTVISTAASDDEKTKIVTPQPTPQPKVEQPKVHIDREPKPKKRRWWVWLLGLLVVVGGVLSTLGGNEERTQKIKIYKVGDYYNENGKEGVVYEVWDGGRHGKIVSLDMIKKKWDSRVEWAGSKYINGTETGANSKSDGKANTDKIMSRSDSEYFEAFVWCREKGKDWYLPAIGELWSICNNKSVINSTLAEYGGTPLIYDDNSWYWSSTEANEKAEFQAWFVLADGGSTYDGDKFGNGYVRAVSAF